MLSVRYLAIFLLACSVLAAATPDAVAVKGGRLVTADEIPPANVLVTRDGRFVCAGALVSWRVVVTAGHCVTDQGSGKPLAKERLGVARATPAFAFDAPLPAAPVTRVVVSLDRVPSSVGRDMAALVLAEPIAGTTPARLAERTPRPGSRVAIFGWGPTAALAAHTPRKADDPGIARGATFGLRDAAACRRHWIFAKLWEDATMLCVDTRQRQLCIGDSGSPAYDGRGDIVAVVSLSLPKACLPRRRSPGPSVLSRPDGEFRRLLARATPAQDRASHPAPGSSVSWPAIDLPGPALDVPARPDVTGPAPEAPGRAPDPPERMPDIPGPVRVEPDPAAASPAPAGSPPRGTLLFAQRVDASSARITGWARDADDLAAAVHVTALVDGEAAGHGIANQARGDVGPHGYSIVVATDERRRTVCVRAASVGPGPGAMIGDCLTIPAYGDLDADGDIDAADLEIVKTNFGGTGGVADLNGDGAVTITDLSILLSRLGRPGR